MRAESQLEESDAFPSLVMIVLVAALGYRYLRCHASRGPVAAPPSPWTVRHGVALLPV